MKNRHLGAVILLLLLVLLISLLPASLPAQTPPRTGPARHSPPPRPSPAKPAVEPQNDPAAELIYSKSLAERSRVMNFDLTIQIAGSDPSWLNDVTSYFPPLPEEGGGGEIGVPPIPLPLSGPSSGTVPGSPPPGEQASPTPPPIPQPQYPLAGDVLYDAPGTMAIKLQSADGIEYRFDSEDGIYFQVQMAGFGSDRNWQSRPEVSYTPLSLIVPHQFWKNFPDEKFRLLGEEKVFRDMCYRIQVSSQTKGKMVIWIQKNNYTIRRIDFMDQEGRVLSGTYSGHGRVARGNWCYSSLTVKRDDQPLFNVFITTAQTNLQGIVIPPQASPGPSTAPTATATPRPTPRPYNPPSTGPGSTWVVILFLLAGVAGLFVLKYVKPATRKATGEAAFAKDVILVATPEQKTGRVLEELGVPVVSYNTQLLGEEVERLKAGKEKPRIIIIAPDAFNQVREDFNEIRNYVHSGGRILILPHSSKSVRQMPFTPTLYSYSPWETNIAYTPKISIWRRIPDKDVAGRHSHLVPGDIYLSINREKIANEIIGAAHTAAGISGTAIGMLEEGSGRYVLCQYRLTEAIEKGLTVSIAKAMLLDIIEYCQS